MARKRRTDDGPSAASDYDSSMAGIAAALAPGAGPGAQIAALTTICEALSFATDGDAFSTPDVLAVVPLVVNLAGAGGGGDPDVILMSVRALTYFCDLMPWHSKALVALGVVTALCNRLMVMEYLDVTEQCLQALEKISRTQPVSCLKAGAIMAVLSYIDFFSISIQRVALSIVVNVCKKIPADCSLAVLDAVPTLCNLLHYEDQKLMESAATCLVMIGECFCGSTMLLEELCKNGVVSHVVQLISIDSRTALSQTIYTGLIGLLVRLAATSPLAVRTLFELNISTTLRDILASDLSHGNVHSLVHDRNSNQKLVVLKLLNQIVPPVARCDRELQLVLLKEKIIEEKPEFLFRFAADILPVSIQVINSGANTNICYGCVSIMKNIVYFTKPDMLLELIKDSSISSTLTCLLAWEDHHVLISTLKIVEILMGKLPQVFSRSFVKEGVVHAIDAIQAFKNRSPSDQRAGRVQSKNDEMASKHLPRCLCYEFDSRSYSSSSQTETCKVQDHTIPTLAKHIMTTYFTESANSKMIVTETLQKLKTVCGKLTHIVDKSLTSTQSEEYLYHMLDQVIRELNEGLSISTFEFVESGVTRSLAHYLTNGKYLQGDLGNYNQSDHYLKVLKRFQSFAQKSLPKADQCWQDSHLTVLIRNLQNALSFYDRFPVILSHAYEARDIHIDVPRGCSTATPCLKVHFETEEGEVNLFNYNDVLVVEFSSSLDSIEEVLLPKVTMKNSAVKAVSKGLRSWKKFSIPKVFNKGSSTEITTGNTTSQPSSQKDIDAGPKLLFLLNGKQLNRSMTLYQAILQDKIHAKVDTVVSPAFWDEVYRVTYRRDITPKPSGAEMSSDASQSLDSLLLCVGPSRQTSFFSSMFLAKLPCELERSSLSYDALFMLKILEGLNRFSFQLLAYERNNAFAEGRIKDLDHLHFSYSLVPQDEFVSSKLTDKLEQQLQDSLVLTAGSMPSWCNQLMAACPFLFSFETRWKYFCLSALGLPRKQRSEVQNPNRHTMSNHRSQSSIRKRFKVNRSDILGSAAKVMASIDHSKDLIEVEYSGEVGTGLGPILEFYTLVSHEFQRVGLGMWRGDTGYFTARRNMKKSKVSGDSRIPSVLFPRPWSRTITCSNSMKFSEVIEMFSLLGQFTARAIQDGRILDLPFSRAFYKLILEQELDIYDIQSFDSALGRTLLEFHALCSRKRLLETDLRQCSRDSFDVSFRNSKIEDLGLDFTLPGYPDYVFASRSKSKMVNLNNLEEYVSLIVDATVRSGISRQMEAFKSGFNKVFPLKALQLFTEDELERLLCGEQDTWASNELLEYINFDQGYTSSSPHAMNFIEIVQEFDYDQRRAFLQFVTGAPRLPPGGLAALDPKLTVVCKHCNNDVDMELPSVMTCANYLKLPPYSSKEIMRDKLLLAITEGQGSFHLS